MAKTTVVKYEKDFTQCTAFLYPYKDGYEYWAITFDGQAFEIGAEGIDRLIEFLKKIQKTRRNKGEK